MPVKEDSCVFLNILKLIERFLFCTSLCLPSNVDIRKLVSSFVHSSKNGDFNIYCYINNSKLFCTYEKLFWDGKYTSLHFAHCIEFSIEKKFFGNTPSKMKEVLNEFHNAASGWHLGVTKMLERLKQRFYWVGCQKAVADWIANCTQYNSGASFERIAMEVADPFHVSNAINRYMLKRRAS